MNWKITSGQVRTLLAFAGGYLLATGKVSMLDVTSFITDVQSMAGILAPLVAAIWSIVDKKGEAVKTDAAIAGAVQVAVDV